MAKADLIKFRDLLSSDPEFREKFKKAAQVYSGEQDEKAVFEHISESKAEQGTGLILLPFAEAMKKVFTDSGIRTISYAMYESNSHANAFREETLNMLKPSITVSENYFLEKGPDVI